MEGMNILPLLLRLWRSVLKCIQDIALQQLLIRDPHLNWVSRWTVLSVPEVMRVDTLNF